MERGLAHNYRRNFSFGMACLSCLKYYRIAGCWLASVCEQIVLAEIALCIPTEFSYLKHVYTYGKREAHQPGLLSTKMS